MSKLSRWLSLVSVLGAASGSAFGQNSYTNAVNGTELWGLAGQWTNELGLNGVPGYNVVTGTGNSNDDAVVLMVAGTPNLNLAGTGYVLRSLFLYENTNANVNIDGNIVSFGAAGASLTMERLDYYLGGRTLDFATPVSLNDKTDGNAFVLRSVASGLDIGGTFTGTEGLRIEGNQTLLLRKYNFSYGAGISNGIVNEGVAGGGSTRVFGMNSTSSSTHDIPNFVTLNDGAFNTIFQRTAGANALDVNINNLEFGTNTIQLRLGGQASPVDGAPIVTVNVNDQIDFSNLQVGNQDITFNFESAFGGIVNFNSNVVINQGIHLDKSVIFNGNGVVNVNADPIRYGFSDPVTMTHILDGARSLTVAVNDEGRLGQGIVDLRPGTVLRLNYDAFGDADGFPGTSMRYGAGTNNLYYDFGAVQSGFYDPVIGDANTPLQVRAFMGVGGRLDNAVYSGVNQNIALYTNAIIAEGSSNLPTRAELGGAILWEGIRNAGGTYTDIGDDGSTSIFRGVAIGALANLGTGADLLSTSGTNVEAETFIGGFHGSLTARAGQDLEVLLPSGDGVVFTPYTNGQVATFNADTGIANVRGMGNMQIQQRSGVLAIGGTATNINRIGYDGTFSDDNPLGTNTQNNVILDLVAAQSIPSNFVFTVTDGRVQVRATDGIGQATGSSNATLIAGSGATLWLDNAGGQANITLNRGKIIIGPGGAFWTGTGDDNAGATTTVISNMVIDPQSLLIVNDGSPTFGGAGGVRVMTNVLYSHLLTNMNIVFSDDGMKTALVETVNSFAIGNNRRLTISGSEGGNLERIVATVGATNNTAVLAAFGASNVFITASAGQTFNIRPEIATTNATVTTFNDTVPFTTVRGDGTMRQTVNQTGTINLYGATNRFNDVSFHGGSINITSNNVLTVGRDIWVTNGATANIQSTNALGRNIGVAQFRDVVNYGALEFKGATSIVNLAESRSGAVRFYGGYSEISNAFASGGGDLLFGDTTNDVTRIFGGIHVVDATNDTSLVSLQNGFVRVDGDILFEPTSNTNLAPGAFASPELRLRASTNLILGSVYLGPTNGIGGSGTLRVGDNDTDVTIIGGDLVINSPAVRQSNRGVEFNRGDVVVSNNIVINPYRLSRFAVTNDLVFNPDGDASRLWIQAQTDTNLTDGFGMYDRLRDGTLALGPDGIRINDYGNLLIELNRTNAVAGGYTIAQKITVDTSGPNYGGTDQKTMWLRAVTNTWDKIVGTGSTPIFNVTNVWMRENAHLRIDEENTEARLGLILMGTNAFLSESSSGTGSGSNEDFDLLDVQSDLAGQARNLYIGTTNGVSDATFESVLFGTGSADVTFNVFNGRLSMTNGGAINGTATVTRDNSIFDILPGTTGDVREVVMQAGWFSNRGDSVNISNLSVSGGFAYLDGGSSFVSNLYMAGGTSAVAAAGVAFDRVTFDGGAFRAVSNYHMAANTVITTNGGGTIVVDDTQTLSVNNVIEGNGGLAKNGLGTLVLSNQNTFLGGATVNEGTLFLAGNNRLATNGNITVVGGVLDLGGNNQDNAAEM
ncbi:MAG: autotransporter-associated beta strand repeat-containing protein, partial [Verrucomicrobiae bacterium]|nr:autotransporter-associated beta strand repeat-containing protein [Verrucomicrobiae bacterium]